jgi:hypothetical protein
MYNYGLKQRNLRVLLRQPKADFEGQTELIICRSWDRWVVVFPKRNLRRFFGMADRFKMVSHEEREGGHEEHEVMRLWKLDEECII